VDGGLWLGYTGACVVGQGVAAVDYFTAALAAVTEAKHSQVMDVDTTAPATTATLAGTTGANGWFTSDVVVSLTSSDPESVIGSVFVQVDGGEWVVYTGPVTLMDGRHLVDYYAVNNAGLSEASHTVPILV